MRLRKLCQSKGAANFRHRLPALSFDTSTVGQVKWHHGHIRTPRALKSASSCTGDWVFFLRVQLRPNATNGNCKNTERPSVELRNVHLRPSAVVPWIVRTPWVLESHRCGVRVFVSSVTAVRTNNEVRISSERRLATLCFATSAFGKSSRRSLCLLGTVPRFCWHCMIESLRQKRSENNEHKRGSLQQFSFWDKVHDSSDSQ